MLKVLILAVLALTPTVALARGGGGHGGGHFGGGHSSSHSGTGDHYVRGYFRRDGTYVQGYMATNPNGTRNDNYSTIGNINPYTGKPGDKPGDSGYAPTWQSGRTASSTYGADTARGGPSPAAADGTDNHPSTLPHPASPPPAPVRPKAGGCLSVPTDPTQDQC